MTDYRPMGERLSQVDALRGFAIFLVVLGHVIFSWSNDQYFGTIVLGKLIYTFHMPLFFFISGYLLFGHFDSSLFRWTRKKFFGLVVPYIIFTIIACYFLHGIHLNYITWDGLIGNLTSYVLPGSAWFLPVLFELFVLLAIIILIEKNLGNYGKYVFPASFFMFLLVLPLTPLNDIRLTYQIINFAPFVMAGYYVNHFKGSIYPVVNRASGRTKGFSVLAGLSLFLVLFSFRYVPALNGLIYSFSLLSLYYDYIVAALGIVLSIVLVQLLMYRFALPVRGFLIFCGIFSMEIYLVHLIVLHYSGFYKIALWPGPDLAGVLIGTIAILALALLISIMLSYNKWISKFFFGRWSYKVLKKTIGSISRRDGNMVNAR